MSIFGLLLQQKQKRIIFYFSGTGNSKWVARQVAAYQHESLIAIADELAGGADLIYTLQPSEVVGVVFPVYSWAPPAIVMEFISKIRFTNAEGHYFFFVCTCGDEAGLTLNIMNESVVSKGPTRSRPSNSRNRRNNPEITKLQSIRTRWHSLQSFQNKSNRSC